MTQSSLSLPELPEFIFKKNTVGYMTAKNHGFACAIVALEAAIETVEGFDACDPKHIADKLRALLDQLK